MDPIHYLTILLEIVVKLDINKCTQARQYSSLMLKPLMFHYKCKHKATSTQKPHSRVLTGILYGFNIQQNFKKYIVNQIVKINSIIYEENVYT